jgi:hypothetical protein
MSVFDVAVAENRQGRVRVADVMCAEPAADLVRARMLVCNEEFDASAGEWTWTGYAPEFDRLPLGATAPVYQAVINQAADGGLSLSFSPTWSP